jgi:hypothetical protein
MSSAYTVLSVSQSCVLQVCLNACQWWNDALKTWTLRLGIEISAEVFSHTFLHRVDLQQCLISQNDLLQEPQCVIENFGWSYLWGLIKTMFCQANPLKFIDSEESPIILNGKTNEKFQSGTHK